MWRLTTSNAELEVKSGMHKPGSLYSVKANNNNDVTPPDEGWEVHVNHDGDGVAFTLGEEPTPTYGFGFNGMRSPPATNKTFVQVDMMRGC